MEAIRDYIDTHYNDANLSLQSVSKKFDYNFNMFHFIDYGHEIAGSMYTTMDIQTRFLETNVIEGKKRIIEAWITDPDVYKGSGPQSRKELYGK